MKLYTPSDKLREIILLTLFGVLMYISQIIMSFLPNIEIVSLLIILFTRKFGLKAILSIYIFVFCEILTYGISMWVINYLYVWVILHIGVLFIKRVNDTLVYALLSGVFGLLFGTFCAIPYFFVGGLSMGFAKIISGIGFDLLHCFGNIILTILLYKPLSKVLNKVIKA